MSLLNSSADLLCSISSHGDTVALCTPDGVIKFYDTLTSALKQEYSPSAHLHATCTCLSWPKFKKSETTTTTTTTTNAKQKKAKVTSAAEQQSSIQNELNDLNLIAIGTSEGSILLYSLTKGDLHSQLDGGHTDRVTDLAWSPLATDSLFSSSIDGNIVEWSLIDGKVKAKWKASKTGITSLNVDPSSKYLVSASKTITVWDLSTKTKVKTLTGHANDIFKLDFLNKSKSKLFVSAALNDRILNLWSLTDDSPDSAPTTAQASFTLNEAPVFVDLLNINRKATTSQVVLVSAVTNKGHLFLFSHDLSDAQASTKLKKPIKALSQIKIETKENSAPLKIYAAFVVSAQNARLDNVELAASATKEESISQLLAQQFLYIVYGSHLSPKIEKVAFSDLGESKITLKRDDPYKTSVSLQTQATKIETPAMSKELKVLAPGYAAPQTNNQLNSNNKRKSTEPNQMTLEERLNVLGIESNEGEANGASDLYYTNGQVPKTDNLLVLLVQGLQSNDAKMLNHVLQHKNDKEIGRASCRERV